VADWQTFIAARDSGAGALWLLACVLGGLVCVLPARWRGWALIVVALYAVGTAWML